MLLTPEHWGIGLSFRTLLRAMIRPSRVAVETFVLVEAVLFAPKPILIFQLWLANPATIFVAVVSIAPEPSCFPFLWVADIAEVNRYIVGFADFGRE